LATAHRKKRGGKEIGAQREEQREGRFKRELAFAERSRVHTTMLAKTGFRRILESTSVADRRGSARSERWGRAE